MIPNETLNQMINLIGHGLMLQRQANEAIKDMQNCLIAWDISDVIKKTEQSLASVESAYNMLMDTIEGENQ